MAWRDTPARKYADIKEQRAYSIGYVDGFYNYGRSEGAEAKAWPNAYSAGFNEGTSDRIGTHYHCQADDYTSCKYGDKDCPIWPEET